jgi:NADH:ubiquinone oxidoreductase subunit 6 (subunit J)
MKITKLLSVIFAVLTICGAIYVIYTGGKANAGYAVIPMILFLISSWPHAMKKHKK